MSISTAQPGISEPMSGSMPEPLLIDPRRPGPLRAEILSPEALESHARRLAERCRVEPGNRRRSSPILRLFNADARSLRHVHGRLLGGGNRHGTEQLDAEWLVDNFHIVEETLREVRRDLPRGYDAELPKLLGDWLGGYPRVYAIALTLVAHTDSELDESRIARFASAFQEHEPLTIGELWALPTMLRLVLVDNLQRLAEQMLWGWDEHAHADRWVDDVHASLARRETPHELPPSMSDPFIVRLLQLLRDQGREALAILGRVQDQLESRGDDSDSPLRREHRRQAANQVSVGNCVTSLRLLASLDWNAFFEGQSAVESILRSDSGDLYILQDFPTRDRYRRAVEEVARGSRTDERAVAQLAVDLARENRGASPAEGHVGHYLVGEGLREFGRRVGFRPKPRARILEAIRSRPEVVYFGSLVAVFLTLTLGLTWLGVGTLGTVAAAGVMLALALPMSELAVGLLHHALTLILPPRVLPKLELKQGIPAEYATIVVIPALLNRPGSASALLDKLEIHHLANPDPSLRFALLGDFTDATGETLPGEEGMIAEALARVKELNALYATDGRERFFFFHRKRLWNPSQSTWMGWERKRGKLSEFNRLARGDRSTSYHVMSADPSALADVRFVITLDADTQMPRDTAGRLVGTLAHPLNRPHFDAATGRVTSGYGVLQPRVSFHLTAGTHSRFAALLAASGGIDPYSSAASDAYMDLFGRGSFTGKGIYELDAFEAATGSTFPENQILSHDLIEGNYARCGLLSDTEFFDDFPARYHAYARREHRWVRGDWQILPWLAPEVPSPGGPRPNPLPALERWKILDNLRRSLVPPALVLLLALAWTILPGPAWLWTLAALAVPALPLIQNITATLVNAARGRTLDGFKRWPDSLPPAIGQALLSTSLLADQARTLIDAITRTLVRLFITRRDLLEWETAATTERRLGAGLRSFLVSMWPAMLLAVGLASLVAWVHPSALVVAAPVLLAWLASPIIAHRVSQPRPSTDVPLTEAETATLRRVARRTWLFFETFVGDADHWLPPDNFQEIPDARIAHRTSPTNQGLLLLSTLAAHDLGYLSLPNLLARLESTFDTLDRLETRWGHFYNWYHTQTLQPLPPAYISTVDSGNLLGCLIGLSRGLAEKIEGKVQSFDAKRGLIETLELATEGADDLRAPFAALLKEAPPDLLASDGWLSRFDLLVSALGERLQAPTHGKERRNWAGRLTAQVAERRAELRALAPWLDAFKTLPPPLWLDDADAGRWEVVRSTLLRPTGLAALSSRLDEATDILSRLQSLIGHDFGPIRDTVPTSAAPDWLSRLDRLIERAEAMAARMDFKPLYKADRNLFAIGMNLAQGNLDGACYDLLASESCLTSYLAVARGEAPRKHWFQLGRPFIRGAGRIGLLSWGGTMFEYLMPRLLLKALPGTLVAEAARTAVARQVEYGRQRGVPWGISESAYCAQYPDGDYQYQSFGVPGLGLKRGLERDLVVAPYATAMATMVDPREAIRNFARLEAEGGLGHFGFYEAIDYTADRLKPGARSNVVRSYMAHHQGMSLVALTNALMGDLMPRRFQAAPMIRAVELLLQERIPRDAPIVEPTEEIETDPSDVARSVAPLLSRRITTPHTPMPRTHLLSNGRYHVLLTNSGSGWSTCRGIDVTRWREDATRDQWGQFCYIRDLESGQVWSAGFQPIGSDAEEFEAVFSTDRATFRRVDSGIETRLEITVSPEQLAEVRRVTITNRDTKARRLDLTSYAEVALADRAADRAHPAFSKLFLETEWIPGPGALLCRRRPRSSHQAPIWAVHVAACDRSGTGAEFEPVTEHETDRARFLGRGRTPSDPAALDRGAALSGTTGPVLDPIFSLRQAVRLEPGATAVLAFMTAVADSREEALTLADQYSSPSAATRAFELAWAHLQLEHRHRGLSPQDAHLFQRLGASVIYTHPALRASRATIAANRLGQSGLWKHGISGDLPIVLAFVGKAGDQAFMRQLLNAHAYLRGKGLEFDLVLLNNEPTSYIEGVRQQLVDAARAVGSADLINRPGGIFVARSEGMDDADRTLLLAASRIVLDADRGPLAGQLDLIERPVALPPNLQPADLAPHWRDHPVALPSDLRFFNGLGGFTQDGREYVIMVKGSGQDVRRNGPSRVTTPRQNLPPAPWINVVANPAFGFTVSEAGSGYTWSGNSQSNRLTPWSNDPVTDPPGEAILVRDEETGAYWSPTPLPVVSDAPTLVRHGPGWTTFERNIRGIAHELTMTVAREDPVKLIRLRMHNPGDRPRRLSATFYTEWVLGTDRDATAMHIVAEADAETGAILARNAFQAASASRVAFADVNMHPRTFTADRGEFLGRFGSLAGPEAMRRSYLSGRVGAGLDPCAAIRVEVVLPPGETREVVFLLGEADDDDHARSLARRYREPGRFENTMDDVKQFWDKTLGAVRVETPEPAMDLLLNRWLLYQVLSCRLWGRSAFYQSGGAFGFRDQLQDVMALVHAAPGLARAQILRAAGRQFVEGDVQHWWHPPLGRGVRTRISDDLLWLPYVAAFHAKNTGDDTLFDEQISFLTGPHLSEGQEDDYGLPAITNDKASLYEHCRRAIERGLTSGPHGLPLMGSGDWNDGMNRVGIGGKGESVWLAWFLIATLRAFSDVAERRGDATSASRWRERAKALSLAVEATSWDGEWYRRAYFDDGTPLGSSSNEECRIDAIAQTWAVISGAGDEDRSARAMEAVEQHLVKRDDGLILLFDPPFDHGEKDPGYIKGYVPGVRENGGQYTHAATWTVLARALQGRGTDAYSLFDMINPIRHAGSPDAVAKYKVEPYVVAADIYGRPPHTGRGGWTWYTGSASWLYRVALEAILGLRHEGNRLILDPCIPAGWPGFSINYSAGSATYRIRVENPDGIEKGIVSLKIDGQLQDDGFIVLQQDGEHEVVAVMGRG